MSRLPSRRQKTAGEALSDVLGTLWPHHTAKHAETHLGLSRSGAENAVKGHAGGVVITKAAHRGGWSIWLALGERLIGQSLDAYFEELEHERRRALAEIEAKREAVARHRSGVGSPSAGAERLVGAAASRSEVLDGDRTRIVATPVAGAPVE